jgi:hypothetical protein
MDPCHSMVNASIFGRGGADPIFGLGGDADVVDGGSGNDRINVVHGDRDRVVYAGPATTSWRPIPATSWGATASR